MRRKGLGRQIISIKVVHKRNIRCVCGTEIEHESDERWIVPPFRGRTLTCCCDRLRHQAELSKRQRLADLPGPFKPTLQPDRPALCAGPDEFLVPDGISQAGWPEVVIIGA